MSYDQLDFPQVQPEYTEPFVTVKNLSMGALRKYYDPSERHQELNDEDFMDAVGASRVSSNIPDLGLVEDHQVVLCEAFQNLFDGGEGVPLRVPEQRQHDIATVMSKRADIIAATVTDLAHQIRQDEITRTIKYYDRPPAPPHPLATSGKLLALMAHHAQYRDSGRAFITHLEDTSSAITTAWRKQRLDEEDPLYDLLRFLSYTHSLPTGNMDSFGAFIGRPILLTPLANKRVLELHDVAEADSAARSLTSLMRPRDIDGNRAAYGDNYIQGGISTPPPQSLYFKIVKSACIHSSVHLEPDMMGINDLGLPTARADRPDYEAAAMHLMQSGESEGSEYADLLHSIFARGAVEVRAESQHTYIRTPPAQEVMSHVIIRMLEQWPEAA